MEVSNLMSLAEPSKARPLLAFVEESPGKIVCLSLLMMDSQITASGSVRINAVMGPPKHMGAMTAAKRLAIAVLEGDLDAALLLADEVQMTHLEGR